jgi:hypothetical protein
LFVFCVSTPTDNDLPRRHYIPSHPRVTSSPLHARAHAAHILVELDTNQDLSAEQRHELQQQSLALQSLARQPSAFSLMETRVVGGKSGSFLSGLDEIQRVVGIVSNYGALQLPCVHW